MNKLISSKIVSIGANNKEKRKFPIWKIFYTFCLLYLFIFILVHTYTFKVQCYTIAKILYFGSKYDIMYENTSLKRYYVIPHSKII